MKRDELAKVLLDEIKRTRAQLASLQTAFMTRQKEGASGMECEECQRLGKAYQRATIQSVQIDKKLRSMTEGHDLGGVCWVYDLSRRSPEQFSEMARRDDADDALCRAFQGGGLAGQKPGAPINPPQPPSRPCSPSKTHKGGDYGAIRLPILPPERSRLEF
jgi:hypothetical protein